MAEARLRIGALSERVGVSPGLLRAWETRYGLLRPLRTEGGFRLYSAEDEERVRTMQRHLDAGVPASEAARLARAEGAESEGVRPAGVALLGDELRDALDRLDEPAANTALDRLLAGLTIETVLRDVVLVYLRELGDRWARGEASVAQEHFASNVLRGRLLGLARGWGNRSGPTTVLACAPGEFHDLPLMIFGLVLAGRGRGITYLGPDTPVATIHDALAEVDAQLVVVSATATERFAPVERDLARLAAEVPVAIAGAGATSAFARSIGASHLEGDPVTAADRVAAAGL
ncbi:MAG TPA: MerR family transcriptional regulator [Gaiellaceae bacterium]|nr:MerR family transcriptional regulator [Gaiellaceae bacterium]